MSAAPGRPLLEVEDLVVHFPVTRGVVGGGSPATVKAVDGVSLTEILGDGGGDIGDGDIDHPAVLVFEHKPDIRIASAAM